MAHRRIGQGVFRFGPKAERQTSLDELGALIDWSLADSVLALLYPAAKGEKAWPPLAMFKALLLATWYDLSDVALADRASFRRFCGFARDEETPERTAFVRFRRLLVAHGLDRRLFEAIALDLESKDAAIRKGTLIDATVIGSASKGDKEAAWVRHRTRAPRMATRPILSPPRTAASSARETTPTNEPDVSIAPAIIPDEPGEVYADRAYAALPVERAILSAGGTARLLRKGHRYLAAEKLAAHNRPLRRIRARIEKIFGTWKRSYRFRWMRWRGLSKAKLQVHLAVIAANVKRYWRLQIA